MAVTKIWDVRDRFDKVLDYVANAKKIDADFEKYHALDGVIDYAADEFKTEKCFYVSGVNCLPENAKQTFGDTQRRWGKTSGIVAYHMYQSFAEGEVDAQNAHDIGVKLAEELFGERFEALIATHLNTDHFHNHIVINAVSWKDGLKYNDCNASYAKIREVSDRLCREYGLSVIEHPKGKGVSYAEWKAEQEDGQATQRALKRAEERPAHNIRMYYLIRRDVSYMRLYEDTLDLLVDHKLKTAQDVINYQKEAMGLIDKYYAERKENYDLMRKAKKVGNMKAYDMARYNTEVLTFSLSKLRREVTTCDEVLERGGMIRENLRRIREGDYRGEYITRKTKNKEYER